MLRTAEAHYARQAQLAAATVRSAQTTWDRLAPASLDAGWRSLGRPLWTTVATAQATAALDGVRYVGDVLAEQGIAAPAVGTTQVARLVGVASDGRELVSLLYSPVAITKALVGRGLSTRDAMAAGRIRLSRIVATQVQDAGRVAAGVDTTARLAVDGYVRLVTPPTCARCAVLAGRFYLWSDGFLRHPLCDCRHIPSVEDAAGDLRTDPDELVRRGEVTDLSAGAAQAIADGADLAQVVNAARGMYLAGGRRFTREGVTRRQGKPPRLMPEEVYRAAAGDRAEAIRLLIANGYLRA